MRDVLQPMNLAIFGWIVGAVFYGIVLVLAFRAIKALEKIGTSLAGIASGMHEKGRSQ
jgi:hypothetical protein